MAPFKNKSIKGNLYSLGHLEPFIFSLATDEAVYSVEVSFGLHCFTEALNGSHTSDLLYTHQGERRAFSVERYELSKSLPDLIRSLGNRTVYWSERSDFFVLRDVTSNNGKRPHLVFFSAIRSAKERVDVRLSVNSAYFKPGMSQWAAPVKFATLITAVAKGTALAHGPKQRIKRK